MPLLKGQSKEAFSQNVATEMKAGKPQKQALAIAYATKRGDAADAIYPVQVTGWHKANDNRIRFQMDVRAPSPQEALKRAEAAVAKKYPHMQTGGSGRDAGFKFEARITGPTRKDDLREDAAVKQFPQLSARVENTYKEWLEKGDEASLKKHLAAKKALLAHAKEKGGGFDSADTTISAKKPSAKGHSPAAQALRAKIKSMKDAKSASGNITYTVYVHVSGSDYTPEPQTYRDPRLAEARVKKLKAEGKSARIKASRPGRKDSLADEEDRIERLAEREMDALDRKYLNGKLTKTEYDKEVKKIDRWVVVEYRRAKTEQRGKDANGYDLETLIKKIKEATPKKDGAMPLSDDCMDMVKGIAAKADALCGRLDGVERTLARGRVMSRLDANDLDQESQAKVRKAGFEAAMVGKSYTSCPHKAHDPSFKPWMAGHRAGYEERERRGKKREDSHGHHREARKGKALQRHAERGDAGSGYDPVFKMKLEHPDGKTETVECEAQSAENARKHMLGLKEFKGCKILSLTRIKDRP